MRLSSLGILVGDPRERERKRESIPIKGDQSQPIKGDDF